MRRLLRGHTPTGLLVALFIIGLIIGAAAAYFAAKPGATKTVTVTKTVTAGGGGGGAATVTVTKTVTAAAGGGGGKGAGGLRGEIPIGILLPQTGSLAADGKDMVAAAKKAIDDFNSFLAEIGAPFRFKAVVADTGTNPEKALAGLQTLYSQYGVQVVVGTASSWVLSGVMNYANKHHIVMISPSSTSPALAIPDYIFRVVGNDAGQGKALATLVHDSGFNGAVVIFRDEAYGRGIAEYFKKYFEQMGGEAVLLPYNPQKSDFAPEVQKLASEVQKLMNKGKKVAVVIVAFETDGINILGHAADTPILRKVRWFSSESIRSPALIKAPEKIRKFLVEVHFEGTFPIPPKNPKGEAFLKWFVSKYGHQPSPFAAYAYDAAYLACLSVTVARKYDGTVIKTVLPVIADNFFGVTGWKALDKNGDLKYQDYSIWKYVCKNGKCMFVDFALYKSTTGKIIPLSTSS
ncbi:MAG: amino acid ABC transporter substrate-binding protein [Crenarchaeota archaeon]|nr:amino acid ABC transporter substrate-binding protein [Thermoproteota archaeon]